MKILVGFKWAVKRKFASSPLLMGKNEEPLELRRTECGIETAHKSYSVFVWSIASKFKIKNMKLMRIFFLSFPTELADSDL
jgi:hypothetical protein